MRLTPIVALLLTASVAAQAPPQPAVVFEAVSIKPNATGGAVGSQLPQRGRFAATNMSVRELIRAAYGMRDFQLEGLPEWASRERYDVLARVSENIVTRASMLVPVLEDRFALRARRETRQLPIYALVRNRDDGQLGPGLVPSKNPCVLGQTDFPPCTIMIQQDRVIAVGVTWTPTFLPGQIIGSANRMVVDRTGLTGRYDITLRWTPDLPPGAAAAPADDRVSLFTALQEQLGLRLQPDTGPVDVLVIESVSRPTPD